MIKPDYDLGISQTLGSVLLPTWDQTSDLWERGSDRTSWAHRRVTAAKRCIKHTRSQQFVHPDPSRSLLHNIIQLWTCIISASTIMSSRGCLETCFWTTFSVMKVIIKCKAFFACSRNTYCHLISLPLIKQHFLHLSIHLQQTKQVLFCACAFHVNASQFRLKSAVWNKITTRAAFLYNFFCFVFCKL